MKYFAGQFFLLDIKCKEINHRGIFSDYYSDNKGRGDVLYDKSSDVG